ncbi:fasciclin domain-containing protein [Pontixanthobacter aestiaquae]|uniref:Fasciclin domain-containing protein n=1 Tax=Pontixanthobacter aestiaquae TaxID=1509367 RepID=A0A844Z552_9SPHN|nr:fasciclin domain-containing protein [Pontixanthobacter aestiaquae]MDN3646140.1 fasciclin domain-containing protein [Pontixanthobacter aestiaquae]MXO82868.1 fasciclin domain-containing protein [Pontixanthobacter aestiaquae]
MSKLKSLKALGLAATAAIAGGAALTAVPATAHHHKTAAKAQPNIVQTAMSTGVHETLVAAVQAAGLVDTLSGPGPFTIFAPTDTAFAKLPDGTVATLVKPENKGQLTSILTYHAVAGNVSAADLVALIKKHGGSATVTTLSGGTLTARLSGDTVVITDAAGHATAVTQTDVKTSNGVIHVTDGVFLPG